MELVNFAREDLGTTITSSCVYDDDYPPSNLVSTDQSLRFRGYRVERFIRPPVQLQLDFAVPILLQSVCIQLSQLADHSTTANLFLPRTVSVKISSGIVLKGNSVIRLINRDLSDELIKPQTALGSFLQLQKEEEGKLRNTHTLQGVTSLVLKIQHSSSYQPPAVKNLEVWGLFDHQRRYNKEEIQKYSAVVKTWQKVERSGEFFVPSMYISGAQPTLTSQQLDNHCSTSGTSVTSQHIKSPTTEASSDNGQSVSVVIPDNYLDEITYEIMLVPMLLPSGHYVDQSTIDKFTDTENSWGRPSADPFTGVPFSSSSKPKFCASLKTHIDKFVTQNRQGFSNLGYTLGDADQIQKHLHKKRPRINIDGDETPERKRQNLPQSDD